MSPDAPSARAPSGEKHGWVTATALLLLPLLLGLALVARPVAMGDQVPGDAGDGRYSLLMLEFFYRTLAGLLHGRPAHFLDAPFFYPWPGVANFANNHWGDAPPYVVARALGADAYRAFQLWFIAGLTLTYLATGWCLRRFGLTPLGAAAGAFLFTFALPMIAQFFHGEFVYRPWVAPAVLALDGCIRRRSLVAGAACLLFTALQFAVSNYLGMFLVLLLAAYAVSLLLLGRARPGFRAPNRGEVAAAAVLLLAGVAVLAAVGLSYAEVHRTYGFTRPWVAVAEGLPRPQSYLLAEVSRVWPDLSGVLPLPNPQEQQDFPGLAAIIALAWFSVGGRARRRQPLAAPMLATAAIVTVLTLDVGGHTLYRLFYALPGFAEMRSVSRVILVTLLPLSVLAGLLVDDVARRRRWPGRAAALALVALLVAESALTRASTSRIADWRAPVTALEAALPKPLPPDAILAVAAPPFDEKSAPSVAAWTARQLDAQLAAVMLGIATVNGYSGNFPPDWRGLARCDDVGYALRSARHFFAEHGRALPPIAPDRLVLIGFGACDRAAMPHDAPLVPGRVYRFAAGAFGNNFIGGGFAEAESWGRWTEGRDAHLYFSLAAAPAGPVTLAVEAMATSPAPDRRQEIAVAANGQSCGTLIVAAGKERARTTCPAAAFHAGDNHVHLRIAHPARPSDLGDNDDTRELGLGLRTLTIGGN
jgi:hypothetical protein